MTADEQRALTPIVEDLQRRGLVATWSTASWPAGDGTFEHSFRVRSPRLHSDLLLVKPFTEADLIARECGAYARQQHADAIEVAFQQSKDALLRDLAALYVLQAQGKVGVTIPAEVTITNLLVPLT